MKHIIYTYKGQMYQAYKDWDMDTIRAVMTRIGATDYAVGIGKIETFLGKPYIALL